MGSGALPERESGERQEASTSQPRQHGDRDVRDEGTVPCHDMQCNLLAQYKADSEGSRVQAKGKAVGGAGVTFGRGQPLQPLPEGSPSPFQVCVYLWISSRALDFASSVQMYLRGYAVPPCCQFP